MATLFQPNGDRSDVLPKNGHKFTIGEMQTLVDGDVQPLHLSDRRILVVNEAGLLAKLPVNQQATFCAKEGGHTLENPIVGTALLCSYDEFCD